MLKQRELQMRKISQPHHQLPRSHYVLPVTPPPKATEQESKVGGISVSLCSIGLGTGGGVIGHYEIMEAMLRKMQRPVY